MARRQDSFDEDSGGSEVKPKTTILNIVLIILNIAAAGGFVYVLVLDLHKRQSWSYAIFMHDLAILGLPLEAEKDGLSASRVTTDNPILNSPEIQKAYSGRRSGGPSVSAEGFERVEERLPARILPQHLEDSEALKEHFKGLGEPVVTLEKEIERIKRTLMTDIDSAAKQFVDSLKTPEDKQQQLRQILLPLAANVQQVRKLYETYQKADGSDFDKLLADACKRRMLVDLLFSLEYFRAGAVEDSFVERIADLEKTTVADLYGQIDARLSNLLTDQYQGKVHLGKEWDNQTRGTVEKRRAIAFTVFAVNHLNRPDGKLLYEKGPERAQAVVGLYEFSRAVQSFLITLVGQQQRVLDLIRGDRVGDEVDNAGQLTRTSGFTAKYREKILRIEDTMRDIAKAKTRLATLQSQNQQAKDLYADRVKHETTITDKLVAERAKTAFLADQLRLVQQSLFRAQVELAEAAEINFGLERDIRGAEKSLRPKGTP